MKTWIIIISLALLGAAIFLFRPHPQKETNCVGPSDQVVGTITLERIEHNGKPVHDFVPISGCTITEGK